MAIGARTQQEDKMELKMTSMIDVVFLLLIFFIVTLDIPKQEGMIDTELPKATGTGKTTTDEEQEERQEFEDIMLTITQDASGKVKTHVQGQWMMNYSQLRGKLRMYSRLKDDARVVVRCANDVPYKHLVKAISIVQMAGLPLAFANVS